MCVCVRACVYVCGRASTTNKALGSITHSSQPISFSYHEFYNSDKTWEEWPASLPELTSLLALGVQISQRECWPPHDLVDGAWRMCSSSAAVAAVAAAALRKQFILHPVVASCVSDAFGCR